jgi:hypothetical protein
MSPLPPLEYSSDKNEDHEKPTWPWEKAPQEKSADKADKPSKEETKKKTEKEKPPEEKQTQDQPAAPEEKAKKHSNLIEQALELVAKHEEEPIPRDATTLARVMIAHRVIHLHQQLQHPEALQNSATPEKIEATLEYIAQLDAKLQDPSIEASPEIEQSYQEIIELAEATLNEEPHLEQIIATMDSQESAPTDVQHFPVAPSISQSIGDPSTVHPEATFTRQHSDQVNTQPHLLDDEFGRRKSAADNTILPLTAAAALIYSIRHVGRKKQKLSHSAGGHTVDSAPSADPAVTTPSTLPRPIEPAISFNTSPRSHPSLSTERQRPSIPYREHAPVQLRRSSILTATAVGTTLITDRHTPDKPTGSSIETHTFSSNPPHESATTLQTHETSSSPTRKIEHMPLLQLLAMAETVSLGNGQYLRREFEAGTIDKEGLIKILKSHSKGRDYQFEFRQQTRRLANLKATSPEFLRQSHQATDQPAKQSDPSPETNEPRISPAENPTKQKNIQPLSLAPPASHELLPDIAESAHQPHHTGLRLLLVGLGAIAGLALVGWLALAIFNALD